MASRNCARSSAILTGAGIALYHVGVEQHWWAGPTACGGGGQVPGSLAELGRMMNQPVPRCDEPAWSLFGISMAGYNVFFSLILAAAAFRTAFLLRRGAAA